MNRVSFFASLQQDYGKMSMASSQDMLHILAHMQKGENKASLNGPRGSGFGSVA